MTFRKNYNDKNRSNKTAKELFLEQAAAYFDDMNNATLSEMQNEKQTSRIPKKNNHLRHRNRNGQKTSRRILSLRLNASPERGRSGPRGRKE